MSEVSCSTGYEGRILVCSWEPYVVERVQLSRDFIMGKEREGAKVILVGKGLDYLRMQEIVLPFKK